MRSWLRVAAIVCAVLMITVVFQAVAVRAHPPGVPGADLNYALASNGGVASSSGYYKSNVPSKANDGSSATYWQSGSKTGWLSVRFPSAALINEVHIHLRSVVLPALSLYYDLNGDGDFSDAGEQVWSTTSNGVLDVVVSASAGATLGIQVAVDAPVGNNKPMANEFEAYQIPPDSDGDGLTDDQELGTFYYQEATLDDGAVSISDDGENATSVSVALVSLWGNLQAAFTNMTIEHPAPAELTVQLGYWNGTGWVDRYLWDPGSHAVLPAFTLSPSDSVGGTASVEAAITNGVALSRMEFYVDGVLRAGLAGDGDGIYEWSWDTRDLGDGTHVLSAVAYDQPGNQVAVSNSVTVDNTGPAVSITEPTSGSTLLGFVETRTLASDPAGVAEVRFYVDGSYAGSTATPQPDGYYHWTWDTRFSVGGRYLRAEAVDTLGNAASDAVSVTVVADTEGPGVSILSPLDGSTVKGWVQFQVAAYDPSHIGYIRFYINETLRGNVSTPQADGYYHWTWDARYANGSRTIRAEAVDTLGNAASQQIVLIADNNLPPEVSIALPVDGATVSGTSLKVVASASDPDGIVVQVRFFRDGMLAYTDTASPWDWTFDTTRVADGWHTLHAEALDNWLSRGLSEPISVCVNNGGRGCREPGPMGVASAGSTVILGSGPASVVVTGLWSEGANHTLQIDLRKGALNLSISERDVGIRGPGFGAGELRNHTAWRLVVRDWVSGAGGAGSGTLVSFFLRTEVTSDPNDSDTDDDGISDGTEVHVWGTLPVAQDSDGDGLTDDYEITPHALVLAVDGISTTLPPFVTSPVLWDTDGDGLSDGEERTQGADRVVTHPKNNDTDQDGLWDGYTVGIHLGELTYGANATLTDTDGDTFSDWTEITPRGLTLTVNGVNENRSVTTLPYANDTDGDGLTDNQEWYGTLPYGAVTDPSNPDTDWDGLSDGDELARPLPFLLSSFESHEDGWTIPPGELVEWHRDGNEVSHSPSFSYHVSRHATLSWSSRLGSPLIHLPPSQKLEISFWSYSRFLQFDIGEFRIQAVGSGYETTLATLTSYDAQSVWVRISADVSTYAAQDVTFAFVFSSRPGDALASPGWFVDDVTLVGNTNPLLSDTDNDLLTDSMEDTFRPVVAYDFDWGARDWDLGGLWQSAYPDSSPEDGMGQALAVGRDPSFPTYNYLTSPRLFLPLSPAIQLRYDVFLTLDWRDSVEVRISADNGGPSESIGFFTLSDPQATWFSDTVDLTAYAGRAIYLEFFAYSAAGSPPGPWEIDEVTLESVTNPLLPDTDHDGLADGAEPLSSPVSADSDMDGISDDYDPRPTVEDDPPLLRIELSQGSNSVVAEIWVTEFSGWSVTLARAHYYSLGTIDEWRDADILSVNPYCCAWVQFMLDSTWHILPEEYEIEITDSNGNKASFWVDVDAYGVPTSLRLQLEPLGPLPLIVLAAGEVVFSEVLLPLVIIIGIIAAVGLVVLSADQGTTQEAYPGATQNPIEVYHDPIFRGEIPLNPGDEKYGWTHIKNRHPDLWTDEKLGIVDPSSDSTTQDQQVRDRIREVIESPSTILNSDASRKTMYFRDYRQTDGKCYWFIIIVGLDGVITAFITTDRNYLRGQVRDFPQVIKPEVPFDPGCRALS